MNFTIITTNYYHKNKSIYELNSQLFQFLNVPLPYLNSFKLPGLNSKFSTYERNLQMPLAGGSGFLIHLPSSNIPFVGCSNGGLESGFGFSREGKHK